MPHKKVYFTESEHEDDLQIYKNTNNELFVSLGDEINNRYITLPKEDAMEIITELAYAFGLLADDVEREGLPTWQY